MNGSKCNLNQYLVSSRNALSQTENGGRCVTKTNNGCKGDNSKRDTDAFHFNLEVLRQ